MNNRHQLYADDILLITCQVPEKKFIVDQLSYAIHNHNNTFTCYEIDNAIEMAKLELFQHEGFIYFKNKITYTFKLETSNITVYSLDNLVLWYQSNQFFIQTGIALFEVDLFLFLVGFVFTLFADKKLKQTINI